MACAVVLKFSQMARLWQPWAGQGNRHCPKAAVCSPRQQACQVMHTSLACDAEHTHTQSHHRLLHAVKTASCVKARWQHARCAVSLNSNTSSLKLPVQSPQLGYIIAWFLVVAVQTSYNRAALINHENFAGFLLVSSQTTSE